MNKQDSFAVVIPAAGSGSRFGGGDKLMTDLGGRSVLQQSVSLFLARNDVAQVVIVTAAERIAAYREHLSQALDVSRVAFVPGGRERWESVLFGLRAVDSQIGFVAVHDAARPLTSSKVINAAFAGAREVGGSVPGVAEPATLKKSGADSLVAETVDRRNLFQAQTPQCFNRADLLGAYETLLKENRIATVTDDAQVFERVGRSVKITPGSPLNIKITTQDDVVLANFIFTTQKDEIR